MSDPSNPLLIAGWHDYKGDCYRSVGDGLTLRDLFALASIIGQRACVESNCHSPQEVMARAADDADEWLRRRQETTDD